MGLCGLVPLKGKQSTAGDWVAGPDASCHQQGHEETLSDQGHALWQPGLSILGQMCHIPTDTESREPEWGPACATNPRRKLGVRGSLSVGFSSSGSRGKCLAPSGFISVFSLCVLFSLLLLSLFAVSISTFFFSKTFISRALCSLLPPPVRPHLTSSLPSFLPFLSLPLLLSWDRSSGLVAICCFFFFFLWGWDQMASNRSSWSPWLRGWRSTWERQILQPGAVRPFLWGGRKTKPLPSYSHIYIFPKCAKTQTLFMFYTAT